MSPNTEMCTESTQTREYKCPALETIASILDTGKNLLQTDFKGRVWATTLLVQSTGISKSQFLASCQSLRGSKWAQFYLSRAHQHPRMSQGNWPRKRCRNGQGVPSMF